MMRPGIPATPQHLKALLVVSLGWRALAESGRGRVHAATDWGRPWDQGNVANGILRIGECPRGDLWQLGQPGVDANRGGG